MPARRAAVRQVERRSRARPRCRRARIRPALTPWGKVAEVDLRLLPQQQLKVTPKQIAANYILQLSSLELQDVINQELQENPALDLEEVQACPLCGQPLAGRVCLNCFGTGKGPYRGSEDLEGEPLEGTSLMQRDEEEDELDPIVRAEAEQTLAEYLSWNTRVLLPKRLHPVAEYIIGNLNDFGYLEMPLDEVAKTLKVSLADAAEVLKTIQGIEPWGIGARDTRECLLIQIDHLSEIGEEVPANVRSIVADHLRELGEHKFGDIAQALRISREDVQQGWDWVKQSLNPYPAHAFAAGPDGTSIGGRQVALRPDVIIVRNEKGVQSLRPLTRAEVGERIGMHESTVSRATAGKFVLLPAGEVIPFSTFFTASLGVKDVIKNIIEAEDHTRPYSDQEIVEKLREEHGIRLARRTVAKYREELQILPARLRKR